ncbi:hypothetical protein K438DRAFT_1777418 [Mycena galopus ATCC 62051]|nr:hypothetical protein K438DRAFT_1777418 [Mycena galopus ATCC 62051]
MAFRSTQIVLQVTIPLTNWLKNYGSLTSMIPTVISHLEKILLKTLFDGTADDQPDTAADETRNLEPAETSVHRRYLQDLRTKTTSEIATHGQPDCYRRGQLFHYAKHALFAVQDTIVDPSGFKPDSLYHLDVLIWAPHLLAKSTSLKCFNSNPIARHIHQRLTDYFLLTNRYLCNHKRINNPGLYLSAWSAIDKQMMGEVVNVRATLAQHGNAETSRGI